MFVFKKLEQLLRERNLTMYKVCKDTKIYSGAMSNWKAGRTSPTVESLAKLAKYFKVPMEYFLDERTNDN